MPKFQIEVESGEYIAPEKMKVVDFIEEWQEKYAVKQLASRTFDNYMSQIKTRIIPAFGQKRIDQIKTMHLVNFFNDLEKEGKLASGTIHYIHRVLNNIFNRAVEW
ncbi:phage integrase N-terminal SAM-like domain-containing protein [Chengkuizengella axinellae]|uniref:Phage integrase N-terminal SAM-like domain-containing protein n=1 Tax=Chengkuizengella axinellae TaxID=3064388 RepID=A0ABT9IV35_9BACL|nr:phage integrase N-terminal SAM-like domain-containing protein [Chengkuizengella sp. 2205SS18-9]MDP5273198.1 phage integrase N-terminal SAM-like domain-containing protein [Chengkuizengella sp. 2205SS18-9]